MTEKDADTVSTIQGVVLVEGGADEDGDPGMERDAQGRTCEILYRQT